MRADIEKQVGRSLQSPNDFQYLIQQIWKSKHSILSLSTIKRLWGYVESSSMPRISTLNTLSQFIGYADWNAYLVALEQRSEIESALFDGEGIRTAELTINDRIEVTWQPNRRCVFRYIGGQRFVVEEAVNSKLHQGDTFDAVCFIVQHPMYLDNLLLADGTHTSYVAGKKNGLTSAKKL